MPVLPVPIRKATAEENARTTFARLWKTPSEKAAAPGGSLTSILAFISLWMIWTPCLCTCPRVPHPAMEDCIVGKFKHGIGWIGHVVVVVCG
jgi:hypothetical protein